MTTVRCASCHHTEAWGDGRRVTQAGGLRRAPIPERAALATVLAARAAGEVVVGPCPACGQPMTSTSGAPVPWEIAAPGGLRVVFAADGSVSGPDGPLTVREAEQLIDRALPRVEPGDEPPGWAGWAMRLALLLMLAPVAVWVFSVVFTSLFLSKYPVGP